VIVQVDGGHIPLSGINAALKPFLALSTAQKASAGLTNIIVRLIARAWPYQLKMITQMKTYLLNAALKQEARYSSHSSG